MPEPIDKIELAPDASLEEKRDFWADSTRPIYDICRIDHQKGAPIAKLSAWLVDRLMFTDVTFQGHIFLRNKKHINRDLSDYVSLQIYQSGAWSGEVGGVGSKMHPYEINIIDFTRDMRSSTLPSRVKGLLVAHDLIGFDRSVHPAKITIPVSSPMGRVLLVAFDEIFMQLGAMTKEDALILCQGFSGLMRALVLSSGYDSRHDRHVTGARKSAINRYIERNLLSESLNSDTLCQVFNISRATLYRDLSDGGGLGRLVLSMRLNRAHDDLVFGAPTRGVVSRTAERWGFSSESYFSRELKRKFGFRPCDAVGAGPSIFEWNPPSNTSVDARVEKWLQQL